MTVARLRWEFEWNKPIGHGSRVRRQSECHISGPTDLNDGYCQRRPMAALDANASDQAVDFFCAELTNEAVHFGSLIGTDYFTSQLTI